MNTLYVDVKTVSSVLANRALAAVRNRDGRERDPEVVARLDEIASIARDLALPDADRFRTLAGAARSGNVRDLTHCALRVL